MTGVVIRFESVNNGIAGNNLFIDNINITGDQSASPPTASFNAQGSVCLGDFIQFSNNSLGGSSYDWSFGDGSSSNIMNPTHEYTSVGSYNVQLTVTNAFGSDSFSQTIVVGSIPSVEISTPFESVCNTAGGFSLNGNPSGGSYSGPGISGNVFSPTTAGVGNHVVTYTYAGNNGCSASDFLTITVDNCVSLLPSDLQSLMLYPNPNKGSFFISGLPENGIISVYSVEGRLISEFEIKEESQSIRFSSPAPGVYRILIRTESGERVLKMIIS
jgi:PKD repeat protein